MVAPLIAGILSTLISNNLPKVAQAVLDKGLDVVEEKLGVKLEPDMSEEKLAEIRLAAQKHEEFRIEQDNKNTADARDMNSSIQTSSEASTVAKNAAYLLDFIIIAATVVLSWLAFFKGIPVENKEIVYTALGSLFTLTGTIINFHRGTSFGSAEKQSIITSMIKNQK